MIIFEFYSELKFPYKTLYILLSCSSFGFLYGVHTPSKLTCFRAFAPPPNSGKFSLQNLCFFKFQRFSLLYSCTF